MLVSGNRDWIEHARKLSTQAREPVVHYEHTEIGFNYRMSNLLAALGRAQLETLPMRVGDAPPDPRPVSRAPRRRPGYHVHARGGVRDLECVAHMHRPRP